MTASCAWERLPGNYARYFGSNASGRRITRLGYLTANTHTAPPCGTSGNSPGRPRLRTPCTPAGSTPHPDCTAMYCFPSIAKDVGWLVIPELVGNCQSSFPDFASNAWKYLSLVPPLKTRPPAVASIGPQFIELEYMCVHTFFPVSTSHAWTSPM